MVGACTRSSGRPTSGKCPRQRRALEKGRQDTDGYRMKFACYFPRVAYGQSSRRPGPGPPSGSPCCACSSRATGSLFALH